MTNLQKHLAQYNRDGELNFDEPTHVYTNEENKVFKSVTQFLGDYEPQQDWEFWGMYTALKDNGLSVKPDVPNKAIIVNGKHSPLKNLMRDSIYQHWYEATRAKWRASNAEAIHRGNNTHNYLEETINKSKGFLSGKGEDNYLIRPQGFKNRNIETVADLDTTDLEQRYPFIYNRLKGYIERDCIIHAEKRLRLDFAQLAGTIDVPIIKRGSKKFWIS